MIRRDTLCPIARAAAQIGDAWTILILRELGLGNDRFDGIQAQTGISSHLLARRLKAMEADGLLVRVAYSQRPKRYSYVMTEKCRELDGVILLLRQWGMRHCGFDAGAESAVTMIHQPTGALIDENWSIGNAEGFFSLDQVESTINPSWAKERNALEAAFSSEKRSRALRRRSHKADSDQR